MSPQLSDDDRRRLQRDGHGTGLDDTRVGERWERTSMAKMNPRLLLLLVLPLLALCVANAAQPASAQGEARVALVIGNAEYPDTAEPPLKDPIANARALADELRRYGFSVDVGENLGKEAMRSALERFYGKIESGSVALFFFSGHGLQSNRQTFMLPSNAVIWREPEIRRDGFSLDTVLAEMNSRRARIKIAILDASRVSMYERRIRSVPAGLAPAAAPHNTAVMYAAAPGSFVRDGERSLFMTELLKEIRNPGKIEDIFNRTRNTVARESRSEQTPWFSTSLTEEFSFVTTTAAHTQPETPKPAPEKPKPEPEKKPEADADARREFQAAERTGTRQAFLDFLARYPTGTYSDMARDRLKRLEPAPAPKPDADADARREYQSAERAGTRQAYLDFLARYPTGTYSDMARERLKGLEPAPRPDADAEARRAFETADRQGTRQAYQDFLARHPTGAYAELARERLRKLEVATVPPPKPDAASDDPAIQELDRRIQRNPNDAVALYKRGQLYAQHGDFDRAVKDFDLVLRINPRDAEALNNRCWARAIIGELQPALKDCNDALQIKPRYVDALDSRGFVSLKLGQPAQAIADYDLALQLNPRHASSLYGRGCAKLRSGNTQGGNTDIAAAKALQSDIVEEFTSYGVNCGP
jgi:tetratricopeptide (TPR) repeat protein